MKTRLIAPIVFSAAVLTTAYAQSQMTTGFDGQTNPAPVASKTVYENNQHQNADSDIFEFGITFAFDSFLENKIAGTTVEANEFYHHIGANLGIVMRWQLNHWMSFLTGLSAIYHHGQYEMTCRGGGTINYHNIMAEIPLQLRYAISFNRTRVRPFASISTNILPKDLSVKISNMLPTIEKEPITVSIIDHGDVFCSVLGGKFTKNTRP